MITFLANLVIPLFIFTLVLYGTLKRKDIYTPFLEGVMAVSYTHLTLPTNSLV